MEHIFPFVLVVLMVYAPMGNAEKVMRPKLKDVNIWSDDKHLTHTFTMDAQDPHVNITFNVLQDVHDVDIAAEVRIIQKKNPDYFFSVNTSLNLCRILNWRMESPIGSLLHAYLKEYGNIFEKCPITKGEYYIHKFWYPEDSASALIPEVNFDVKITAHAIDANKQRTLIMNDHVTGEGLVQDVSTVKRGILAMLPKAG